jgi:hypothetical protein
MIQNNIAQQLQPLLDVAKSLIGSNISDVNKALVKAANDITLLKDDALSTQKLYLTHFVPVVTKPLIGENSLTPPFCNEMYQQYRGTLLDCAYDISKIHNTAN